MTKVEVERTEEVRRELVVKWHHRELLAEVLETDRPTFEADRVIEDLRDPIDGDIILNLTEYQLYQVCVCIIMFKEDDFEPTGVYESAPYLEEILTYCRYVSGYDWACAC